MLHSKKLVRIFLDMIGINLSYVIACYVYKDFDVLGKEYLTFGIIINLMWFSSLILSNKLYSRFEYTTFRTEIMAVLNNYLIHSAGIFIIYFFIYEGDWRYYIIFYSSFLLLLFLGRFLLKKVFPSIGRFEKLKYIVIGNCDVLPKVESTIHHAHLNKVQYLGSFGKKIKKPYINKGGVDELYNFLKSNKVNMVLYASNEMESVEVRKLINFCLLNFIEFKIIPLEVDLISRGVKTEVHNGYPIISVKDENIARIRFRLIKRLFDIVFSSLVIIFLLSWLYPLLSILIKLQSPGPALFKQKRIGYRNNEFVCYKFRSMKVHEDKEVKQATKDDDRVTKIGAFMRKTSLDEMPQFFNVLKGNMSVVGPRPHAVSHDIEFQNELEEYILRHYTKPGISGWAQVNGFRGPTDTREAIEGRTRYDLWYLRNWSFFLDIKIIFLTVFGKKTQDNAF